MRFHLLPLTLLIAICHVTGLRAETIYGRSPLSLTATSTSGNPVTFSTDNPAIASIEGNTLTIKGAGIATITASAAGNSNYLPVTLSRTFNFYFYPTPPIISELSNSNDTLTTGWEPTESSTRYAIQIVKIGEQEEVVLTSISDQKTLDYTFDSGNTSNLQYYVQVKSIVEDPLFPDPLESTWSNKAILLKNTHTLQLDQFVSRDAEILLAKGTVANNSLDSIDANITLAPGAKLLNSVDRVSINKLNILSEGDISAQIGAGQIHSNSLTYTKTIDDKHFYFFSLPYDFPIAQIKDAAGNTIPNYNNDWVVAFYDGAKRSENLGSQANFQEMPLSGIIKANQGYIIATQKGLGSKTFVFNFGPIDKDEQTDNSVPVIAYGSDKPGLDPIHIGWNLVGMPYLSSVSGRQISTNYLTLPNSDGKTYTQVEQSDTSAIVDPFRSYFIQTGSDSNLTYTSTTPSNSNSAYTMQVVDRITLNLSVNGEEDYTTLLVGDCFEKRYEIGYDLEKMIGIGTVKPQLYSITNNTYLAFNAQQPIEFKQLPMGMYSLAGGEATIRLTNKHNLPYRVYLNDKTTGIQVDISQEDYTFASERGTTDGRFTLSIQRIETSVPNQISNNPLIVSKPNRILFVSNLESGDELYLIDASGRYINSKRCTATSCELQLAVSGYYTIQVNRGSKRFVLKTVVQ